MIMSRMRSGEKASRDGVSPVNTSRRHAGVRADVNDRRGLVEEASGDNGFTHIPDSVRRQLTDSRPAKREDGKKPANTGKKRRTTKNDLSELGV